MSLFMNELANCLRLHAMLFQVDLPFHWKNVKKRTTRYHELDIKHILTCSFKLHKVLLAWGWQVFYKQIFVVIGILKIIHSNCGLNFFQHFHSIQGFNSIIRFNSRISFYFYILWLWLLYLTISRAKSFNAMT